MPPLSLVEPLASRFLTIADREQILVGITAGNDPHDRCGHRPGTFDGLA